MDTIGGLKGKTTHNGIPQGDILSPLVFLIYTTYLELDENSNATTFQFADDICILAWGDSEVEANCQLNTALDMMVS